MQVGGVFVRIRPALAPEDARQLEDLAATARAFADALDAFRDNFVVVPSGGDELAGPPIAGPLRLPHLRVLSLPEGDPAA